jgi:DNA-binding NtrC family response regulator
VAARSVWVVDDDVSIGWVLEKALNRGGYEVRVFRSVKPLLVALKSERPHIVISDIKMPGVDGLKLLELLSENLPSIPVIIMTAYSDFETTISSYKKGAFEYLSKPFDIDQVLVLVKQAMLQVDENSSDPTVESTEDLASDSELEARLKRRHAPGEWQREFEHRVNVLLTGDQADISRLLYREIDKILIQSALHHTHGHKQRAAKSLGWGRNTLTRKMQDLGL